METESHYIMECVAYEDIGNQFENNLTVGSLSMLFEEARLHKTANLLIKIHSKNVILEGNLRLMFF